MSMFDSLYIECPRCGEQIEFQSKAGHCNLDSFSVVNVPASIAIDIKDDIEICSTCNNTIGLHVQIAMYINPYVKKARITQLVE